MKKIIYFFLFVALISFTSCFDVIEQLLIKNDGSGTFQAVLNLSKSKTKLNSIIKMKKINGHKVPSKDEISKKVNDLEAQLKKVPGISNVKTLLDFDNFIVTINCNFLKVENLNNAIKIIGDKNNNKVKGLEKMYEYDASNKIFYRVNKFLMNEEYQKMSNADKEIFSTATYTGIFRFDNDIVNTSNTESKIAANKKATMVKLNAMDIITNKKTIENKINLKK